MKNPPLLKRIAYAANGIFHTAKNEGGFWIHTSLCALEIALLLCFGAPFWNVLIVFACAGAILSLELMNTAVENVLDLLHPALHPKAKIAKDCAAGAVFLMSLIAGAITLLSLLL